MFQVITDIVSSKTVKKALIIGRISIFGNNNTIFLKKVLRNGNLYSAKNLPFFINIMNKQYVT
jgi:hypothetical protein